LPRHPEHGCESGTGPDRVPASHQARSRASPCSDHCEAELDGGVEGRDGRPDPVGDLRVFPAGRAAVLVAPAGCFPVMLPTSCLSSAPPSDAARAAEESFGAWPRLHGFGSRASANREAGGQRNPQGLANSRRRRAGRQPGVSRVAATGAGLAGPRCSPGR